VHQPPVRSDRTVEWQGLHGGLNVYGWRNLKWIW